MLLYDHGGGSQETDLDVLSAIDDMGDVPDGKDVPPLSPFLAGKLDKYRFSLVPIYNRANSDARQFQTAHKNCMKIFILTSTIAVILALFQLYDPISQEYWMFFIVAEAIALITVTTTILLDLKFRHYHMNWMIERHRAERCRFLKFFDMLLDDETYFTDELARIQQITEYGDLEDWIHERGQIQDITRSFLYNNRSSQLKDVLSYFLCRRVFVQMNYFMKRHLENRERKELWTKKLPILFVSIGIFLAFIHVAWEILERIALFDYSIFTYIGVLLLFLVIGLPIGVWMLNSFSLVFSYRAHAERYGGIYIALKDCLEKELLGGAYYRRPRNTLPEMYKKAIILNKENECSYLSDLIRKWCGRSAPSFQLSAIAPQEIFFGMLCLEDLLEGEHEEWIRITKEAVSL